MLVCWNIVALICSTPGVCACARVSILARVLRRWGYEWAERGVLSKAPSRQWDECYLLHCTSAVLRRRKETEEKEVSILIHPGLLVYIIRRRCRCACSVVRCGRQPRFPPLSSSHLSYRALLFDGMSCYKPQIHALVKKKKSYLWALSSVTISIWAGFDRDK